MFYILNFLFQFFFPATKTRPVVKTASICRLVLNVAKHSMQRVNRKHVVRVDMLNVRNHRQWPMVQYVRNVDNVEMENVCRTVRPKVYKVACATLFWMHANGNIFFSVIWEFFSNKNISPLRCCRMSINETCFPVEPPDILPDGTPCIQGFCNKVRWPFLSFEKEVLLVSSFSRDYVRKPFRMLWNVFGISLRKLISTKCCDFCGIILSVSILTWPDRRNFFEMLYNLFFFAVTVVVLTAIFWIPASCLISFFDRKKRREQMKDYEWSQTLDLIHPSDRRRVIHIR